MKATIEIPDKIYNDMMKVLRAQSEMKIYNPNFESMVKHLEEQGQLTSSETALLFSFFRWVDHQTQKRWKSDLIRILFGAQLMFMALSLLGWVHI